MVREDHEIKVLYPFKPILQVFRGPPLAHFGSLGVRGSFFLLLGVHGAKKVKNPLVECINDFDKLNVF